MKIYSTLGLTVFAGAWTRPVDQNAYIPYDQNNANIIGIFLDAEDGNNLNNGLSQFTPVRTIARAREVYQGLITDGVLTSTKTVCVCLKRGDEYELSTPWLWDRNGVSNALRYRFDSWGNLSLPKGVLKGSKLVSNLGFTETSPGSHIWVLPYATMVKGLYKDGVRLKPPQSIDYQIMAVTNVTEPLNDTNPSYPSISVSMVPASATDYYKGAYIRVLPSQWNYDVRKIRSSAYDAESGLTTFTLERVSIAYRTATSPSTNPTTGGNLYRYGFQKEPSTAAGSMLQIVGHLDHLVEEGEGFYDELSQNIYVYSEASPLTYTLEAVTQDFAMTQHAGTGGVRSNIWIQNIEFRHFGHSAIQVRGNLSNWSINSNTFRGITKYGLDSQNIHPTTKANLSLHSDNLTFSLNEGYDIGVELACARDCSNALFQYNIARDIGNHDEGLREDLQNGLTFNGTVFRTETYMTNVKVATSVQVIDNDVERVFTLCQVQGNGVTIARNNIRQACYALQDGAGIYLIDRNSTKILNCKIYQNIIDDGGLDHVPGALMDYRTFFPQRHGIYLDEGCPNFEVFDNVITGGFNGIMLNTGCKGNKIYRNIVIGRYYGLHQRGDFSTANNQWYDNTVILSTPHSRAFSYIRPSNQTQGSFMQNNRVAAYLGQELAILNTTGLAERTFNQMPTYEEMLGMSLFSGTVLSTRHKNLGQSYVFSAVQNRYLNGVQGVSNTVLNANLTLSGTGHSWVNDGANGIKLTVGANSSAVVEIATGENFRARTLYQGFVTLTSSVVSRVQTSPVMPFVLGTFNNNGQIRDYFRLPAAEPVEVPINFYINSDSNSDTNKVRLELRALASSYTVHIKNIRIDKGGVYANRNVLPPSAFRQLISLKKGPLDIDNSPARLGVNTDYGNITLLDGGYGLEVTGAGRQDFFVTDTAKVVSHNESELYSIHGSELPVLSLRLSNSAPSDNYYNFTTSNAPGDGSRTLSWAQEYADNWSSYVWNGPQFLDANGAVRKSTTTENEPTGNFSCQKMLACAYVARVGVHLSTSIRQTYAAAVRSGILALLAKPRLDFRNTTLYPTHYLADLNPVFLISAMTQRVLESYDYVRAWKKADGTNLFTLSEKQQIESWLFMAQNLFVIEHVNIYLNGIWGGSSGNQATGWTNRVNRTYGTPWQGNSLSSSYTHYENVNGVVTAVNQIPVLGFYNNNRRGTCVLGAEKIYSLTRKENNINPALCYRAASGSTPVAWTQSQVNSKLDELALSAKLFCEEFIKFATFKDGTPCEMERQDISGTNWTKLEHGWYYSMGSVDFMVQVADLQARRGDPSLYELQTREGKLGTEATASDPPKTLYGVVDAMLKYVDRSWPRTRYATNVLAEMSANNNYRIDGFEGPGPEQYVLEGVAARMSLYYKMKGDAAKMNRIMNTCLRLQPGNSPLPLASNAQTSGEFNAYTGFWGFYAMGVAHRLHNLQKVDGVNPY